MFRGQNVNPVASGISLINGNTDALCTSSTTAPVDTRGAKLFLILNSKGSGVGTPVDSSTNTYTGLTQRGLTNPQVVQWFYSLNPTTSASTTFSVPPSGDGFPAICVFTFSGVTAFDQETGSMSNNATTIQPGSITPSGAKELFVVGCAGFANMLSIDSGFTLSSKIAPNPGVNYGTGIGFFIDTGTTTKNPTCTFDSAVSASAGMVTFR